MFDTIEQSVCRLRTEEEDRAVEQSIIFRAISNAGGRWIEIDPDHSNLDWVDSQLGR